MICKINPGGTATIPYVGREGTERLECGTMVGRDVEELGREFDRLLALRPGVKTPILHFKVSLPPEEDLTNPDWCEAMERLMEELGYRNARWCAFRHFDEPNPHVHIAVCRIEPTG